MKTENILKIFMILCVSGSIICCYATPYIQAPEPFAYSLTCAYMLVSLFSRAELFINPFLIMLLSISIILPVVMVALIVCRRNYKTWLLLIAVLQIFSALFQVYLFRIFSNQGIKFFFYGSGNFKFGYGFYLNLILTILAIVLSIKGLINENQKSFLRKLLVPVKGFRLQRSVAAGTKTGREDGKKNLTSWSFPVPPPSSNRNALQIGVLAAIIVILIIAARAVILSGRGFTGAQYGIEMVLVRGGTFTMGCMYYQCGSTLTPTHEVTLSDFYIGKYEVTQKQWKAVMGENNNPSYNKGDDLPVERVSWNDVQEFIEQLNAMTGKNYRLPTEAEWEYAARGGNHSQGYRYSGGNIMEDVAWYSSNSEIHTRPVGKKKANELGLYDMSGNVREWVNDWYEQYSRSPQTNPQGPVEGHERVLRGGTYDSTGFDDLPVHSRNSGNPDNRRPYTGFRLALSSNK